MQCNATTTTKHNKKWRKKKARKMDKYQEQIWNCIFNIIIIINAQMNETLLLSWLSLWSGTPINTSTLLFAFTTACFCLRGDISKKISPYTLPNVNIRALILFSKLCCNHFSRLFRALRMGKSFPSINTSTTK